MRKTFVILGALLFFITIAQAQSKPSPSTVLKLGYVKDRDSGCGCRLSHNRLDLRNRRNLFISSFDQSAYVNVDEKIMKLRLVAASKEKLDAKLGDRSWETYSHGSLRVRIDYIVSRLCDANDEACEVIYYKTVITITRGRHRRVVKAVGICGC